MALIVLVIGGGAYSFVSKHSRVAVVAGPTAETKLRDPNLISGINVELPTALHGNPFFPPTLAAKMMAPNHSNTAPNNNEASVGKEASAPHLPLAKIPSIGTFGLPSFNGEISLHPLNPQTSVLPGNSTQGNSTQGNSTQGSLPTADSAPYLSVGATVVANESVALISKGTSPSLQFKVGDRVFSQFKLIQIFDGSVTLQRNGRKWLLHVGEKIVL